MKKYMMMALALICAVAVQAQEVADDEPLSIDELMDAFYGMQEAIANNDTAALARAAEEIRAIPTGNFESLRCYDDSIASLDGHVVFAPAFADSLLADSTAYSNAEEINRQHEETNRGKEKDRGQKKNSKQGEKFTKTCIVRGGGSSTYSFMAENRQELGIVAEAGGLVTVRIHVTGRNGYDKWYNDTTHPEGTRRYRTAFDLPSKCRVTLEVINKTDSDTSFVVISN